MIYNDIKNELARIAAEIENERDLSYSELAFLQEHQAFVAAPRFWHDAPAAPSPRIIGTRKTTLYKGRFTRNRGIFGRFDAV